MMFVKLPPLCVANGATEIIQRQSGAEAAFAREEASFSPRRRIPAARTAYTQPLYCRTQYFLRLPAQNQYMDHFSSTKHQVYP